MIRGVPYDAEVEYLSSFGYGSSGQVINTSVLIPSDCTHIEYIFKFAFTRNQEGTLCGHQALNYQNPRTYLFYSPNETTARQFYVGNNVGQITLNVNEVFEGRTVLDDQSKTIVVYRGADVVLTKSTSGSFLNKNYPVWFFGGSLGSSRQDLSTVKIWYFKIVHGTIVVRDFIPVRFTNEAGQIEGAMYDRVSKQLFRNAGTGSFVIGPDVSTPVIGLHFMREPLT